MTLKNIIAKTEEYLQIPSVTRFEQPFLSYLAGDFSKKGYWIQKHERLLAVSKKGVQNPKILTAHIDRHGIVVNKDNKFEYAAFNAKKDYGIKIESPEAIFKGSGEAFVDELVYAYDASGKVLDEGEVKSFSYDYDKKDLFFEIDGLRNLPSEVAIAYKSHLELQNGKVSSQIDNAICAAVAYQLVQDGFDGKIIFAAEEEIGNSWQYITSYLSTLKKPSQEIIVLDTTPYNDSRAIDEGLVVLRNKDENGIFNPDLVKRLRSACDQDRIKYQFKDELIEMQNARLPEGKEPIDLGKTELGRIVQHTNGKYNGSTLQLPTTNYHTNHETTSEKALENYYQTLLKLL